MKGMDADDKDDMSSKDKNMGEGGGPEGNVEEGEVGTEATFPDESLPEGDLTV